MADALRVRRNTPRTMVSVLGREPAVVAITLGIAFAFGAWLSFNRVTDPFLYYDVALVEESLPEGNVVIPETGPFSSLTTAPGRITFLVQLAGLLGLDARVIQFFPLGAFLVPAMGFLFAKRATGSTSVACLYILYLTLNLSHATAIFSVFAYGLALPLFFAFCVASLDYLEKREPRDAVLMFGLFIALNFTHYTVASWAILFLLGVLGSILVHKKVRQASCSAQLRNPLLVILALSVFFLAFNQALYDSYLPGVSRTTVESAMQRFLTYFSLSEPAVRSPVSYTRPAAINLVSSATLLLILLPVVVGGGLDVARVIRRGSRRGEMELVRPITMALVVITLADIGAYSLRGSISTKAISYLLPLLSVRYIGGLHRKGLAHSFLSVLLATSLLKVALFYENAYVIRDNGAPIHVVAISSHWLQEVSPDARVRIMADMSLYGKYLLTFVEDGSLALPVLVPVNQERLEILAGHRTEDEGLLTQVVALDVSSSQPTTGFVFSLFRPLRSLSDSIEHNPGFNLLYDDGWIWLGSMAGGR